MRLKDSSTWLVEAKALVLLAADARSTAKNAQVACTEQTRRTHLYVWVPCI